MARKIIAINRNDVGAILQCTLVFTGFDPSGATAGLYVGAGRGRAMTLVGNVASYTIQANDFNSGYFDAQVCVKKGGVTLSSEMFTLAVT